MRVNAKLRNSAIPSANFPIHDIYQDVVIKPLMTFATIYSSKYSRENFSLYLLSFNLIEQLFNFDRPS